MRSGITSLDMSVLLDDTGVKEKEKKKLPSEKRDEEKDFVLFEEEEKEKEETKKLPSEKLDEDEFFVLFEEEDREDNQQSPGWGPAEDDDFINGLGIEERLPGQRVSNGALKIIGVEDEDLEQLEEIRKEGEKNREGIRQNFIRNIGNVFAKPNSHTTQMQANMFEGGTEGRTEERSPGQKVSDGALKIMGVDDEDLERLEEIRKEGEKKKTVVKEEPEQWKPTPEEWAEYSEYDIEAAKKELAELEAKNSSNTVNIVSGGMNTKGSNFNTVNTDFSEMRANEERAAQLKFEIYIASLIQQVNEEYEIQNDPKKMTLGKEEYDKWAAEQEEKEENRERNEFVEGLYDITGVSPGGLPPINFLSGVVAYDEYKNDTSYKEPSDQWTDEEKYTWGWYMHNGQSEKADKYAMFVNNGIILESKSGKLDELAEDVSRSDGRAALHSIATIFARLGEVFEYGDNLIELWARGTAMENEMIMPSDYINTVRETIRDNLNAEYGTLGENWGNLEGRGFGDIYQFGMGAIETALPMGIAGRAGSIISIPVQFASSANAAYYDALGRDINPQQAMTYANVSAGLNTAADAVSLNKWIEIDPVKDIRGSLKNVAKQGFSDIPAAMLSMYGTEIADNILMGDKSKYNTLVNEYMLNYGLSRNEAEKQVQKYLLDEITFAILSEIGNIVISSGAQKPGKYTTHQTNIGKNVPKELE